ncbi:FUSC family protein [Sphingobium yanoikuyae]|uniref:FUSC family protein n=1 Tax=Sphingobium yanoikuyae TaxID=13690 RepID=UPI0022DE4402|nr:FUSC family protein [Sphingobium yanoikuyae]WBQ15082.1 FUSC family protein [Sphingobium yanoikuyae]
MCRVTPALPQARWMADRYGGHDALFTLKAFLAAMLAYYIALRIGLDRPYWAIITAYIVAQPLAGAVSSKAMFRLLGTVIGAGVAILLVPLLGNAPELLSLALALWLGLCTFVALLDRTPRAYTFLLAGYTAGIVAFPAVEAQATIFTAASLRAQEIGIGIASATLVHSLVFPRTVSARLQARIDAIMIDAERWSRDSLRVDHGDAVVTRDRRQLATDIHELHQLATHLPFESSALRLKAGVLRALETQLCLLLPLASAVEDRCRQLQRADALPPAVHVLLDDVVAWLGAPDGEGGAAEALRARARACEPDCRLPFAWHAALQLSMLDRLAELVAVHAICRELQAAMGADRIPLSRPAREAIRNARRRVLHRDYGLALRGALATSLTVLIGCLLWILSAWPAGAGAVVIASIICALFSNMDDPAPAAWKVWQGTCCAVLVAAPYAFAILPRVSDFPVLVAVLAPAFLLVGAMMVRRRLAAMAIGMILSLPGLMGLDGYYTGQFDSFANAAIAQMLGALLAVWALKMVRTVGAEQSALRLLRAGWRDLALRTDPRQQPDTVKWINTMLDRIGLLTPRLAELGSDTTAPLLDILRDTRVGMSLDDLHRFRVRAHARDDRLLDVVLGRVRQHFDRLGARGQGAPDPALVRAIDTALATIGLNGAVDDRRLALLALTSLRRNIAPDVPLSPRRDRENSAAA